MLRIVSRTGILLGLALIVVVLGASAVEAKGHNHPRNGQVPFVGPVAPCIDFDSSSVCNPDDDDADGWAGEVETRLGSDPHDAASTPEYGLLDEQTGSNTCHDGIDNDRDGRTDAQDPGCRVTCRDFARGLACTDRDHDGWLQYVEKAYGSNPEDHSSTPETPSLPSTCFDGIDNDNDGLTDDADPSCNSAVIGNCIDFTGESVCTDPP
jgi:hypothetical protein